MNYPPPTLIPRKSRASWGRRFVFVGTLGLLVGTCTVARIAGGGDGDKTQQGPLADPAPPSIPAPAEAPAPEGAAADISAAPVAAAPADVVVAPPAPAIDARQLDHWYYVPQIGDGPGAIYSRKGGGWDYAFACTAATHVIEFIAVNTGDPGNFDQQYVRVGRVKLMLDAAYSKEGHGTISSKLPAKHPFFDAFVGTGKTIEIQLLANQTVAIPVGSAVTRLIRDCRGNGEVEKAAGAAAAKR
ncbi:hypothetical protein SAMN05444678_101351 [Sphingomonas sp. YR710]|uniref:hypothetical protein n=1 Tax=Sphingomonas sp. YR710 TaxID=1882773 RepID=UPI00088EC641|nr:hypothetical protein [Sphingomonas sp. YR710]SDC10044.1 hypothetical protein SAMN05444678_101351 [Sphingomonas sp. YR710]